MTKIYQSANFPRILNYYHEKVPELSNAAEIMVEFLKKSCRNFYPS
jgi:hypothetical protein